MLVPVSLMLILFGAWGSESAIEPNVPIVKCSRAQLDAGLCNGNNEGQLDLGDTRPGGPGAPGTPADHPHQPPPLSNTDPQNRPDPDAPQPAEPDDPDGGGWQCMGPDEVLVGGQCVTDPPAPEPEEPEAPAAPERPAIPPEIDQRDVATFAPEAIAPTIEPFGVAIMNAPMNVAFDIAPHTVGGSLFDLPVSVTFTPDLVTIDYGDGTQTQMTGSAATWSGLGQQQLTPTATSHTYGERGTVTVTVDVAYVATVDFGQWGVYPVSGHIVSRGAGTEVRVYEKQSYLVERTCLEDPRGPGC